MTNLEFLLVFSITPIGAMLIGLGALYLTRHDRRTHHPAGE